MVHSTIEQRRRYWQSRRGRAHAFIARRWMGLTWAIERRWHRWSPFVGGFFIGWRGLVALIWHRLGCKFGWVPSHGDPKRPEKRWLSVTLDMSQQRGTWNPPPPPRGGNGQA